MKNPEAVHDGRVLREDYQPPAWLVESVELEFDLRAPRGEDGGHSVDVLCRQRLRSRDGRSGPLRLDGRELELRLRVVLIRRLLIQRARLLQVLRPSLSMHAHEREMVLRLRVALLEWYDETCKKRYAPGGPGEADAAEEFAGAARGQKRPRDDAGPSQ